MLQEIKYFFESSYKPLLIALIINALLHLPFINRPPESTHTWRQCNTLAIARNFAEEDMNILHPRVDNRLDKSGITGANFPAYEWGLAAIYKITGERFWVHRTYTSIIFFIGIAGFFLFLLHTFHNYIIANAGAIALLFFPDLFYYQLNALPDILAFTTMIWGFYYFIRWFDSYKLNKISLPYFIASALLLSLAGLVKLYFLLIGFAILGILAQSYQYLFSLRLWCYLSVFALLSVGIPIAWYVYAIELIKRSGLTDFGLEIRSESNIKNVLEILNQNIISDLPELILNFSNTGFLLVAIYYFFKEKAYQKPYILPALFLFIGVVCYHIIELKQMRYHSYYMMPYYPFLALIVSYGAYKLWKKGFAPIVLALLIASPILASIRIFPARWMNKNKLVAEELYNEQTRNQLIKAVPNDVLCIVGEDNSKCIHYYYLHKKGFGFSNWKELLEKDSSGTHLIHTYINRGAQYLYLYTEAMDSAKIQLAPYLGKRVDSVGHFSVYPLIQ